MSARKVVQMSLRTMVISWLGIQVVGPDLAVAQRPEGVVLQRGSVLSVTSKPEEIPEFKRIYSATVGDGFKVTLEARTWKISGRYRRWSGEVRQSNGRYVWFEPERVADKIIDRELYPLVQAVVDEAMRMDSAFIRSNPSTFTDEDGQAWQKAVVGRRIAALVGAVDPDAGTSTD